MNYRKTLRFILLVLVLCVIQHPCSIAQKHEIDSLQTLLKSETNPKKSQALQYEMVGWMIKNKAYNEAISVLSSMLNYYDIHQPDTMLAKIQGNLGLCFLSTSKPADAIEFYEKSESTAEKLKADNLLMRIYPSMVYAFFNTGNTVKSLEYSRKLLTVSQHLKDNINIANAYHYIGISYQRAGEGAKALENYQEAYRQFKALNDKESMADVELNIGNHYQIAGDNDKAEKYLLSALNAFTEEGKINKQAKAYANLSSFYMWNGDSVKMNAIRLEAVEKTRNTNNQNVSIPIQMASKTTQLLNLVGGRDFTYETYKALSPEKRARFATITDSMSLLLDTFKNISIETGTLMQYYYTVSKAQEMMGSYEKAFQTYVIAVQLRDSFNNVEKGRQFADLELKYEFEKSRDSIKLIEKQKRLELQKEIDLKNLRFEFEKKQAAAKSEEERKRLLLEEELKRKEIEMKYEQDQKAAQLHYEQEKKVAQLEQEKKTALSNAEIKRSENLRNLSAVGAFLAILVMGLALWFYFQKRKDNYKIASEKQKSDELLLNILPVEVAEELKQKGESKAQRYDEVSVLFTDFVNFTKISEQLGVEELLNELNINFTAFDKIMEKHGLEKIKTIGDAYLAVCGLPVSDERHAQNTVYAALDILAFVQKRKQESSFALDIRIGINSGSLIAGIIGVKKFAYDIWGDTVNTAARMEQSSEPGKINISENTFALVKDEFTCIYRGKLSAKGKGEMDMYFVERKDRV